MKLRLCWLVASSAALCLASASGEDGLARREPGSSPLVSAVVQQQVAPVPEPIPAPLIQPLVAGDHDEELIGRTLGRPQPADPASRVLRQAGDVVHGPGMIRLWEESVSLWEAPAYCHRPLYFEDEMLERHGRSYGLFQPAASIAHFTRRGLALPYLAGAFPHHECVYPLGRYQPGTYAGYHWYRPPLSARGALYEAAVATGLSYIVP